MIRSLVSLALAALLPTAALAQANGDPAIDIELTDLSGLKSLGRIGTYPNGTTGFAFATTVCNTGTVEVEWEAAMSAKHPFISFLVTRESDGRMVQISDRSYVKHGVFAANASLCGNCVLPPGPLGALLGLGCSDTYGVMTNGDRLGLGPADEIDPWLGRWEKTCSHFDRGEPPVAPPNDCDNVRSLTGGQVAAMNEVTHRIEIDDDDLLVSGDFYYQTSYIVPKEIDALRVDDLGSRQFQATWSGLQWNVASTDVMVLGSVLERWKGATVTSEKNGDDDGRVYVGVSVTGPDEGLYHYELALHNRDNARGVGELRIPICPGARLGGFGFRDIDADPNNDWTASVQGDELVFTTTSNPLDWNTIYNVWFDTDAAPEAGAVELVAFDSGVGSASFDVTTSVPTGLYNVFLGSGCSSGTPATLYALGSPARATLGNATFALASSGNAPGARNLLLVGTGAPVRGASGCVLWVGASPFAVSTVLADASGVATHPLPIPASSALEGLVLNAQCSTIASRGATSARIELSDALQVRIGDLTPSCP